MYNIWIGDEKMTILVGSSGTGEIILNNFSDFHYSLKSQDKDSYEYQISYKNQFGTMRIVVDENGQVTQDTVIDLEGFTRSYLGAYNDPTLIDLAKKMIP